MIKPTESGINGFFQQLTQDLSRGLQNALEGAGDGANQIQSDVVRAVVQADDEAGQIVDDGISRFERNATTVTNAATSTPLAKGIEGAVKEVSAKVDKGTRVDGQAPDRAVQHVVDTFGDL